MIYKRGQRYRLKAAAVQELISSENSLAFEHEQLKDRGFGPPHITIAVSRSGLATIRATWRRKIGDVSIAHRYIIRGIPLA